jgi:hypothetical protein
MCGLGGPKINAPLAGADLRVKRPVRMRPDAAAAGSGTADQRATAARGAREGTLVAAGERGAWSKIGRATAEVASGCT